jgi:transposase-like protein
MKPKEEIREIVKRALRIQGGMEDETITELAQRHGIARNTVYEYLKVATDHPVERLRQAEEEVEFRIEVLELMGYDVE